MLVSDIFKVNSRITSWYLFSNYFLKSFINIGDLNKFTTNNYCEKFINEPFKFDKISSLSLLATCIIWFIFLN